MINVMYVSAVLFYIFSFFIVTIQSKWIESIIFYKIKTKNISINQIFNLYSNLTQHPAWSPWIKNVLYDESSGTL